jgi:hypothetical protein
LGVVHSGSHALYMTRNSFETTQFCAAFDLERVPSSTGSGLNASRGESISLQMTGLGTTHARALLLCHADLILELTDNGAVVLQ